MKRAKRYAFLYVILLSSNLLFAQKDSVQALFSPPKFNIHYSHLQWELGYNGFVFKNNYVGGIGVDLIGAVFNDDANIAIGFDQGGTKTSIYSSLVSTIRVQSYSSFYLKIEPMLFPEKVINISMPLKFGVSSITYIDTTTYSTSTSHRRRVRPTTFPSVEPGLFTFVNVFPNVNFGVGISYRVALSTTSAVAMSDYDNFIFSAQMRLKLFTRNHRKIAAKKNDFYDPNDRFQ